jgi:hypothetical protein
MPPPLAPISLHEPPICALRVGVVGHRPPKLGEDEVPQLRKTVREILTYARTFSDDLVKSDQGYAPREPILRIVSSLAEGSDRLVAEEGLELGFKLHCPLPAFRDEYRQDFVQSSADTFDQLLKKAEAVFELPGRRAGQWLEPAAYEAAGRMTLASSDMLIAIWDGEPGERAGTGQMVNEAQQAGIPTIRIASRNPALIEFLSPTSASPADWRDALRGALTTALRPPDSIRERVAEFLSESFTGTPGSDPIDEQRAQADQIAGRYAIRYRRAYKAVYALAPLAVLCAVAGWWLLGKSDAIPDWVFTSLELLCILAILLVTWLGRSGRWHERWLDARVLAEQFRTWAFLAPLAQTPPTSRLPPYVSTRATEGDWTGWFFRARAREQGLRSARLTPEYLAEYQRQLLQVIQEQAGHHLKKGKGRKRTYERMEVAALIFFGLTALACAAHLLVPKLFPGEDVVFLTTMGAATAALPAIGAALEGLQAQEEYQRLSERADGMYHFFTSIQSRLPKPEDRQLSYTELAQLAHQVSGTMLDELSDWRNLVRVRVLHPV